MNIYKYKTKLNKEGTFKIPAEIRNKINDKHEVEVILLFNEEKKEKKSLSFIDKLETDLGIADLSENHDKYFYGDNIEK
jgi:bifunctional DNA-binding transcriptional regulator/antitoxin component of YhaV-PrlF toxin-antitoxin module